MSHRQLIPAFRLVRTLLGDQARSFQELLKSGIEAVPELAPRPPPEETEPQYRKFKGKPSNRMKKLKPVSETSVPEGHPFVSGAFLKHKVLPVLESQHLVIKAMDMSSGTRSWRWHLVRAASDRQSGASSGGDPSNPSNPSDPSDPSSSTPSASSSSSSPLPPRVLEAATRLPNLDRDSVWDRLLSGTHPGVLAADIRHVEHQHSAAKKEARFEKGLSRRTEREMRAWEGREPGLTTRLERDHLNDRRARARPEKERRTIGFGLRETEPSRRPEF